MINFLNTAKCAGVLTVFQRINRRILQLRVDKNSTIRIESISINGNYLHERLYDFTG